MVLSLYFKEFIQSLNEHEVRYLIIGGYAVAVHGHPTKDLEVNRHHVLIEARYSRTGYTSSARLPF